MTFAYQVTQFNGIDYSNALFDSVEEKERHMKLGLGKLKQFQCPKCEFRACHYNGAKEHFAKIHLKIYLERMFPSCQKKGSL